MLKLPSDDEVEAALAALPAAGHGLTVLPHWAGERAPGWRGDRLGAIVGLRLDTTALEITRAALEAVALRLALVYDLLAPCAGPAHTIVASGGALARSRVWTQIIADALGQPIRWSPEDRKSTRLNSSHGYISYAVFCLKKKKKNKRCMSMSNDCERHI